MQYDGRDGAGECWSLSPIQPLSRVLGGGHAGLYIADTLYKKQKVLNACLLLCRVRATRSGACDSVRWAECALCLFVYLFHRQQWLAFACQNFLSPDRLTLDPTLTRPAGTTRNATTTTRQRHMDDKRFERELKHKEVLQKQADQGASKESEQAPSATYDAFMRMQTGQETRTIADKINDPNRVSWEQFRKVCVCVCVCFCGHASGGNRPQSVREKSKEVSGWRTPAHRSRGQPRRCWCVPTAGVLLASWGLVACHVRLVSFDACCADKVFRRPSDFR